MKNSMRGFGKSMSSVPPICFFSGIVNCPIALCSMKICPLWFLISFCCKISDKNYFDRNSIFDGVFLQFSGNKHNYGVLSAKNFDSKTNIWTVAQELVLCNLSPKDLSSQGIIQKNRGASIFVSNMKTVIVRVNTRLKICLE